METEANPDENYYCIEMGEEMFKTTSDDVEPTQAVDDSHALVKRNFEHGKGSYFFCTTCDKSYLNIEDYIESHQINTKSDDEFADDLIEYDAFEDKSEALSENTTEELKNDTIKNEFEDFVETSAEKYFCYDCRTCFKELVDAEQHDCPGFVVEQTESDVAESCVSSANVEPTEKVMCAFCETNFDDLAQLEQHQIECPSYRKNKVTSIVQNEQFVCVICSKTFVSLKALNTHSRSHKNTEEDAKQLESTCHICNTSFGTNKRLKLHMRIHEEQPTRSIQQVIPEIAQKEYNRLDHFFCEICNKSFDQRLLEVHKSMHQRFKWTCELCNRDFNDAHSYEVHQQMHELKGGEVAIRTGPTDAMLRNAKKGIKSIHVDNAKQQYPCQYCGHVFWRPFEKLRHERVHTGEKPYKCEVCGKQFRVPYSLTLHLRTHTDLRPFVCSMCNKRFKSHSVYTHHLLTHQNDRSYNCDMCEKTFRTSVQLNAHKKSHTKPFNCTECNRPFASLHAVKLHMKSHDKRKGAGNPQQSCNICGAVYARTIFLRAHLKDHHGVESSDTGVSTENEFYLETAVEEEENVDESEAALLITAAADAEAREEQRHRLKNDYTKNIENDLIVDPEYLTNELIMDSFEETVATGF